jgi:hypothetical protein
MTYIGNINTFATRGLAEVGARANKVPTSNDLAALWFAKQLLGSLTVSGTTAQNINAFATQAALDIAGNNLPTADELAALFYAQSLNGTLPTTSGTGGGGLTANSLKTIRIPVTVVGAANSTGNATYAAAILAANSTGTPFAGQFFGGGLYDIYQMFCECDTSLIPAGTIVGGSINFAKDTNYFDTSPEVTIEVRFFDFGASITVADFRTPAQFAALPLVFSANTVLATNRTGLFQLTYNGVDMANNLNRSGLSRFVLCSNQFRTSTAPASNEYAGSFSLITSSYMDVFYV